MYHVYILQSQKNGKFYIGQTDDIEKRLHRHNTKQVTSTKKFTPWSLVYHEEYQTRQESINEETRLKKMKSRVYIEKLINFRG